MKQPMWIINSGLLVLLFFLLLLMYFSKVSLPQREEIEPKTVAPKKETTLQINIEKIYENDLFDTFRPEIPSMPEEVTVAIPDPPIPAVAAPPEIPKPAFLEPLDITLRGIFVVNNDSSKNRAVIQDNKTAQEATYKVGDTIEGATLIRIYNHKIIFLRPNGQQEVLYLREQDAKLDPAYAVIDGWDQVAQPLSESRFMISPSVFVSRVQNLAQFIDLLGITTAFKEGRSVGCRIAHAQPNTFGEAIGLQTGDLITTINDTPVITTDQRLKVYQQITNAKEGDIITVQLMRNKIPMVHEYLLKDFSPEVLEAKLSQVPMVKELQEKEKLDILKKKHEFAPTMQEIRKKERQHMMRSGKAPLIPKINHEK